MNQRVLFLLLLSCVLSGCGMATSNEIVILLPGTLHGQHLVLAETSANNISINRDIVPSLILEVWWNDEVIVTQNHPMKPRHKFPSDTYQVPDRKTVCWYLVHPATDSVLRFDDFAQLQEKLASLGFDPANVKLMTLHRAQSIREKELGFEFSASSVNQYVKSQTSGIQSQAAKIKNSHSPDAEEQDQSR